jgi:hypothetical protein
VVCDVFAAGCSIDGLMGAVCLLCSDIMKQIGTPSTTDSV